MRHAIDYIKNHKLLILIILPAFFLYMLVIFPSGTFFCFKDACGINFWGVHGHDAIWHLAIANTSFNKFPFISPIFAGENLYGYNYLLDFFIFLLSKLRIPAIITYFKIFPVIWFIFFTLLLIILARKIKDHPVFTALFLFFNYFTGSFYYLIKLYQYHSINDSSTELPQPIVIMMSNPPYAASLLFFLWILILIKNKKINIRISLLFGFLIFIIMGLKFYGGVISIFLVFTSIILSSFGKSSISIKKTIPVLLVILVFIISAIIFFYNPIVAAKTGSAFAFVPFALIHTITENPNYFYLQDLTDARYYLMEHGIGPRLIAIESLNFLLFLFFYLGTRFFGLLYIPILLLRRRLDKFDLSVILSIGFSILLMSTLVQKGEWWNTIQFFYYAIFMSTIYLSKLAFDLVQHKKLLLNLVVLIIIILSIPSSLDMIKFFFATPGATYLSQDEQNALEFLKKQPAGVVLTSFYNKEWKNYTHSNQLYTYDDTSYVAAFSGKPIYLTDELQLRQTGVPYKERMEKIMNMDCSILKEVNYVYEIRELPDNDKILIKCKPKNTKKIYNNGKINIYSIIN